MSEQKNYNDIMKDVILKGHEIIMSMNVKTENEGSHEDTIFIEGCTDTPSTVLNAISRFVDAIVEAERIMPLSAISHSVSEINMKSEVVDKAPGKVSIKVEAGGLEEINVKANELVKTLEKAKSLENELANIDINFKTN